MGKLIGYMSNRADRLRDALHQERAALGHERAPSDASGWGVGFYHGDEVLHKKRPMHADEVVDWEEIAGDVHSDCAILHLRQPTVGDFRAENAHPFRLRSWTFAHQGTIDRFDQIRDRLAETIPDYLRRNIRGDTDSEYLFHTLLAFLHDAGQIENPDVSSAQLVPAVSATVALVERLTAEVGGSASSMSCLLTNGRTMIAVQHGSTPMCFVERQGLYDTPADYTPPPAGSVNLRYVLVLSNGQTPEGYTPLKERTLVLIDRNLAVHAHAY